MTNPLIALIDGNFKAALGNSANLKASSKKGAKQLDQLAHAKLFEILALSELLGRLKRINSACTFELMNGGLSGNELVLQSAPGMADPSRSYIRVRLAGAEVATIWTNVEFEGISGVGAKSGVKSGSYHEADILMMRPNVHNGTTPVRPNYQDVLLVIECKFLSVLPKVVLRALLGLRREMSMLTNTTKVTDLLKSVNAGSQPEFTPKLNANPSSHLVFFYPDKYKFSPEVEWKAPARMFGIEFWPH
jgi:hypothetical protein